MYRIGTLVKTEAAGVEYGILVAAVGSAIIISAVAVGDQLAAAFAHLDSTLAAK
jgi:Flp pilus assembly pilin Flp